MKEVHIPDSDWWVENVPREFPEPGMYADVPVAAYRPGWHHVSQSTLKVAIKHTPAKAVWQRDNQSPSTKDRSIGSAFHARILEPEHFDDLVMLGPGKSRSATWRQQELANPNMTLVTQSELDTVNAMAANLMRHDEMRLLRKIGYETELSVVADLEGSFPEVLHADRGPFSLRAKSRLDMWCPKLGWIVDLKKTEDGTEEEFGRSVYKYGYHFQAAFYIRMMAALGIEVKRWVFAITESNPPYLPVMRDIDPDALAQGHVMVSKAIALWALCMDRDDYPGFPPGILRATLPGWAKDKQSEWEVMLDEQYRT